jgi:hypothetical protein
MAGSAGRKPTRQKPSFDESNDVRVARGNSPRIECAFRQRREMRRDIRHLLVVEALDNAGHQLINTGAILEVMQLLIDRERGLPGHVGK